MHILVTGGAGYIGSVLVPQLLEAGHQVTVVDNFRYGQNSLAAVCAHPGFDVIRGDVRDASLMTRLTAKADAILPLAAYVGAPLCHQDPVGATSTNRDAVLAMVKTASPSQWILMPTTNSAYGSGDKDNHCDEQSPLNPLSLYAKDKVEVERVLMERERSISFRLATVFGMSPRMRLDLLVNDFTHRAISDRFIVLFEAHFKRNYIHVRDVARVFLHGLTHFETMKGGVYNVGLSDANVSKLELCQVIRRFVPEFVIMEAAIGNDPDQRNYIVSNRKIEAVGYRTEFSLERGIEELIKGYRMLRNTRYGNV